MSVASKLTSIAESLRAKLDAINTKLIAKGQTEAANLNEVPDKIEAIETKKQDVLNLVSGITKYTDPFKINGELRSNVLVQPSDFSDESTITWSSRADSYFSHSIENIEGSENGSVMVLNPVKTTETSVYNLFWFNSTVDASTSEPRTYLIAVRAKASETITSYFPNMAITYYPTGLTGAKFLYFSYTPTTEWQTFYVIANIPENYYLKDITMCFCSRGITHYIDWIAAYDITGTDFDHMTFGAKATASASDILSGKIAYIDGVMVTGTMPTVTQATPTILVSPSGLITASATQSSGYVSSDTKSSTQQLSTKDSTTYTPGTNNQTISAGTYLTGTQTIKGDSNLVANNIKSGVSIFGVNGSYEGGSVTKVFSGTVDATSSSTLSISLPEDVSNLTLSMFALARRKADAESGDGILSYSSFPQGAACGFGGLSSNYEYAVFGSQYMSTQCSGNVLEIITSRTNPDLQFCTNAMYNYLVVFESN
jgi:hypothetical protein